MQNRKPETPNQIALLSHLRTKDAKLVGNGWCTPTHVRIPGVPNPIHVTTKETVKACLRRGWLIGSKEDGYRINGYGVLALGRV